MRSIAIAVSLAFVASSVTAQGTPSAGSEHAVIVQPDQVSYAPAPAALPPGAELAIPGSSSPSEPAHNAARPVSAS
jgi:hypothetical protein